MPQYLSTDPNAGRAAKRYLSTDPNAGRAEAAPEPEPSVLRQLGQAAGKVIDPFGVGRGVIRTIAKHPVEAGAIAGGALAAPLTGGASIPAAMMAAGLGSAGGAGVGLMAKAARGDVGTPATPGAIAGTMAKEGGLGLLGTGAGRLLTKGAGKFGRWAYQKALKPTNAASKGDPRRIAAMVETGLEEGINPTAAGSRKIERIVGGLEDQITPAVRDAAAQGKRIDRLRAAKEAEDFAKSQFAGVAHKADDEAIEGVVNEFVQTAPADVGKAFDMQRTEGRLLAKTFGERKGADVEARKAIQHAVRKQAGEQIPAINPLLERESRLLRLAKPVADRTRTGGNLDILGLAPLAAHPAGMAAFLTNRAPGVMGSVARTAYRTGKHPEAVSNAIRAALIALMGGETR